MSEIFIKGLKIKDYPQTITINPDGSVIKDTFGLHRLVDEWKAIEVPPHGDLIDRQKLLEHRFEVYDSNEEVCEDYIETYHVLEAPAIIEASEERE